MSSRYPAANAPGPRWLARSRGNGWKPVSPRDRLAVAGPNGSGKTTLLNIIRGSTCPDSGSVRFGAKVELASLAQNRDQLDLSRSPFDICGADTSARTLLACLKLRRDEPTNHLEIEAQEALEQALEMYPGAVIVVSHDRVFLGALGPQLATLNLEIGN
jgi:ATPase subunit of ABC transporter with duplicated ATPase domains